jgi:hypothetical protein
MDTDGDENASLLEKRAAISYVSDAFEQAKRDGLDLDCVAYAALFAAFKELVIVYGEDAAAGYAQTLPSRILSGAFSMSLRH